MIAPRPSCLCGPKSKYKTCKAETYRRCKEWFKRPWWFQESDPVAKFSGWVAAYTLMLVIVSALQFYILQSTENTSRQTQRAWVGLDDTIKIDVLETTPRLRVESHYRIKNFGNGPALKVMSSGWFDINPKTEKELVNTKS